MTSGRRARLLDASIALSASSSAIRSMKSEPGLRRTGQGTHRTGAGEEVDQAFGGRSAVSVDGAEVDSAQARSLLVKLMK
jgi:hypothetical protein